MSDIIYKGDKKGKKSERNKFVEFDLKGLEQFIVPRD